MHADDLCEEIVRGLVDTMKIEGRLRETAVGCVFAVEEGETATEVMYWDDITGMPLDYEGVMAARAEELEVFRKFGVYHKVKLNECYDVTGKAPI